jgi:hypothetical protein
VHKFGDQAATMSDGRWPNGDWSRGVVEDWADTAERLAFHPATPSAVREVLMRYVRGVEQQMRMADSVTVGQES